MTMEVPMIGFIIYIHSSKDLFCSEYICLHIKSLVLSSFLLRFLFHPSIAL